MKFLVTGAEGQLGRVTVEDIESRGIEVLPTDIPELPVEDMDLVQAFFREQQPTHVLHCGAMTDVDGCELDPDLANKINGVGTGNNNHTAYLETAVFENGVPGTYGDSVVVRVEF